MPVFCQSRCDWGIRHSEICHIGPFVHERYFNEASWFETTLDNIGVKIALDVIDGTASSVA